MAPASPGARAKPPFRADHVGSFLRPKKLLDARDQFAKGAIDADALRAAEDDAIRDIVKYQEDLGLHGITDGEFRRNLWHADFLSQFQGIKVGRRLAARLCASLSKLGCGCTAFADSIRRYWQARAFSRNRDGKFPIPGFRHNRNSQTMHSVAFADAFPHRPRWCGQGNIS